MRRKKLLLIISCLLIPISLLIGFGIYYLNYWNLIPSSYYTATELNLPIVKSRSDFNNNGIDDYTDILNGARKDIANAPVYDGSYQPGGYPPENVGVCTDVVWRAFREAGYSLKDMIDADIAEHLSDYPRIKKKADPNIDFRRVPNLRVFFQKYALSLTLDPTQVEEWQPGDIVTYGDHHIAIVSDRRTKKGVPYIIHNGGQPVFEEDALTREEISGHFRFDASKIEEKVLKDSEERRVKSEEPFKGSEEPFKGSEERRVKSEERKG